MKIRKLRALNINSLKGETEIDFETFLEGASLFAITGPTGAGKSTILDIITCALYGRTPRLSNPNDLMSRHSGECFCEVEFAINERVYRCSWSQKRAYKKADGNFQTAKMELAEVQSGKVLESKLREVPKKVQELSGLDFERFTQSMMLAQGSFDAFFKAKENDRSSLLERITGTQVYKQISQEVYETYAQKKREIELEENALGAIELLEKEQREQKSQTLSEYGKRKRQLDAREGELKKIAAWQQGLQTLERDSAAQKIEYEKARTQMEQNGALFNRLELAKKAGRAQEIYRERELLRQTIAEDARQLGQLERQSSECAREIGTKQHEADAAQKALAEEKSGYEAQTAKLKRLRELRTQIESIRSRQHRLEQKCAQSTEEAARLLELSGGAEQAGIEQRYEKLSEEIAQLTTSAQELEQECEKLESRGDSERREESLRTRLHESEKLLEAVQNYEQNSQTLHTRKQEKKRLEESVEQGSRENAEKAKLVAQMQKSLELLQDKREHELLIKKYESDRARLRQGQECFLCGAKEHPYIDHGLNTDPEGTQEQIQRQERQLQEENARLRQSEIELGANRSRHDSVTEQLATLELEQQRIEQIFAQNGFTYEKQARERLEAQKREAETRLGEMIASRKQQRHLQEQRKRVEQNRNEKIRLQIRVQSLLEGLKEATKERKEAAKEAEALQEQGKAVLDVADPDTFEQNLIRRYETVQQRANAAQNRLAQLRSTQEALQTQIKQLRTKQESDEAKRKAVNEEFAQALREQGFADEEEFAAALLDPGEYEELAKRCEQLQRDYERIQTLQKETARKLKEQQALKLSDKSLQEVTRELAALQEEIDTLQKRIGSVEKELEIDAANRRKHAQKIEHIERKKEAFAVWVKLNEMVGSSSGDKFAKFAQGITLDQLIYLANRHLRILSPRYELQRAEDANKQLEIEIIDGFQGDAVRPVSTLSGGESFIVSLSLALGLSNLASQKIAIDSLFLDEGFGTLDGQSLELALNALNRLQDSGKMVGVISHVEALKERIPLQIKVVPKGDGTSRVEMSE